MKTKKNAGPAQAGTAKEMAKAAAAMRELRKQNPDLYKAMIRLARSVVDKKSKNKLTGGGLVD